MRRSILTMLAAAFAFFAITASASAHVVTVASGGVTCSGITASWTKFPAGPFDLVIAFTDTANGKAVTSPYLVEHLTGPSGSQTFAAPAANGVTNRKYLLTWTADGGGSVSGSVVVKSCNCKPKTPPTTTTTTTPGTTVTTTTPGQTTTTPGQTVTVTKTVTTPAVTNTVTVTGPTTTVTGPTTTVTTPGPTRTIYKQRKPKKPKVITKYRIWPINVICPPGYVGSYAVPIGTKGKPIVARCKPLPHKSVEATGVTG